MATAGRKSAMVRRLVENRRAKNNDLSNETREKVREAGKVSPEEEAEKIRILREAGLIK